MLTFCMRKVLHDFFRKCSSTDPTSKLAIWNNYCTVARHVKPKKGKGVAERKKRHFVDYAEVLVSGGSGGNGMLSFLSLPNQEWAGPDGGNGGNGGHVLFKASHNTKSLAHLKAEERARNGDKGKTKHRDGKNAEHYTVEVPLGTVVKSVDGRTLTSLDKDGDLFVAARGGAGGKGNYFFLSNENRAPDIAELGATGQERQLFVELKTMAHAGLIGFPNAGKSTLLRAISRAQPAVSAYPFTTLNPHVGMVLYDDHEQIAVADIPGLIPGAHKNKGLGISFLRHIERCLCLVYVIDLSVDQPWEQFQHLRFELNQYQAGLADRPNLLIGNKIDVPGAKNKLTELEEFLHEDQHKNLSSQTHRELPENRDSSENRNISGNEREDGEERQTRKSSPKKSMPILGVSAKKQTGIEEFLHCLRVMYDNSAADSTSSERIF